MAWLRAALEADGRHGASSVPGQRDPPQELGELRDRGPQLQDTCLATLWSLTLLGV